MLIVKEVSVGSVVKRGGRRHPDPVVAALHPLRAAGGKLGAVALGVAGVAATQAAAAWRRGPEHGGAGLGAADPVDHLALRDGVERTQAWATVPAPRALDSRAAKACRAADWAWGAAWTLRAEVALAVAVTAARLRVDLQL